MTDKWTLAGLLKEPTFLLISLLIFIGQVLIVSFGGEMFSVEPLTFKDWLQITIATSPVLLVGIISGFIRRKLFAKV